MPCNWTINFIHFFLQDATIHKKKKDFRHEVGNPYNESEYTLRKGCLLGRSMQQSSSHSRVQKYCYFKKLTIAYRQINRKLTTILSTNNIYSRYTNQCIIIVNHTLIVFYRHLTSFAANRGACYAHNGIVRHYMPNELDVFICGFMLFGIVAAVGGKPAAVAMRGAGLADIAAVEKQPMVRLGDEVGGDIARKLVFGLAW